MDRKVSGSPMTQMMERLSERPLLRGLSFRPGTVLPDPMRRSSSLASALLYRQGTIAATPCRNCARGNGPFNECVPFRPRSSSAFETEPFYGAWANCLANGSTTCSLSKSSDTSSLRMLNVFRQQLSQCRNGEVAECFEKHLGDGCSCWSLHWGDPAAPNLRRFHFLKKLHTPARKALTKCEVSSISCDTVLASESSLEQRRKQRLIASHTYFLD